MVDGLMVQRKKSAFSLLEMMFVMVVVATILLYVGITMRSRSEEKLVARTGIEIETLLQAAANYYTYQQSQILNSWGQAQYYGKTPPPPTGNFWPVNLSDLVFLSQPFSNTCSTFFELCIWCNRSSNDH